MRALAKGLAHRLYVDAVLVQRLSQPSKVVLGDLRLDLPEELVLGELGEIGPGCHGHTSLRWLANRRERYPFDRRSKPQGARAAGFNRDGLWTMQRVAAKTLTEAKHESEALPLPRPCSLRMPLRRGNHRRPVAHRTPRELGSLVLVVAAPPLVGLRLRIPDRRVLPLLLSTERGQVEKGPDAAERLDAAVGREVGAENVIAVAN